MNNYPEAVAKIANDYLERVKLQLRLVPVTANGQPAFAVYQRAPAGAYHAHAVLVLTVTRTGIARIVSFRNPDLFGSFGLPQEHRTA